MLEHWHTSHIFLQSNKPIRLIHVSRVFSLNISDLGYAIDNSDETPC